MAPLAKVEQDGIMVELASEIIMAGANPFLDRLPKPVVATATPETGSGSTDTTTAAALPADPFASISLLGIAYHPTAPMALISVTGGESQTQMVRKGDVLTVDTGAIKVAGIGPESVDLQRVGANTEKRTMSLPSIIGFGTSANASGQSGESGEAGKGPAGAMPSGPSAGMGQPHGPKGPISNQKGPISNQKPDLSNLSKISSGAPSAPPVGPTKGTNVSLQEP
jgi:hypothetical protein